MYSHSKAGLKGDAKHFKNLVPGSSFKHMKLSNFFSAYQISKKILKIDIEGIIFKPLTISDTLHNQTWIFKGLFYKELVDGTITQNISEMHSLSCQKPFIAKLHWNWQFALKVWTKWKNGKKGYICTTRFRISIIWIAKYHLRPHGQQRVKSKKFA